MKKLVSTYIHKLINQKYIQCKPVDAITLGSKFVDNFNAMITINNDFYIVIYYNVLQMGSFKSDHNQQLITLTGITLSEF